MANRVVKLTVLNDVICPNCAVAQHELFEAMNHCKDDLKLPLEFQIEYLPFRLMNTTLLPQDYEPKVQKVEFFNKVFGQESFARFQETINNWAAEKGVPLTFNGVVSQSTRAHRLSRKAFRMGGADLQLPYLTAIFRVHLQEGKDVGDINVLSDVAAEVGIMTKAEAIAFLQSNELEDEVNQMCDEARAKGISGVPLVVIDGKWAVSGGQSSDVFIQIFKKLAGVHVANVNPTFGALVPPVGAPLVV
ncbi:Polyketide biosynthesis associated protein [Mycena sanguinolenta]|uniref:Polyketide biosynthesis associated protein n=1 Tax=Mycena sanguinolenta TaxID=230812 RepID=A0A8H7DK25_9AGAR|nr:Polyketide biosynthesis associated protein [Mycena sanguinolenta]